MYPFRRAVCCGDLYTFIVHTYTLFVYIRFVSATMQRTYTAQQNQSIIIVWIMNACSLTKYATRLTVCSFHALVSVFFCSYCRRRRCRLYYPVVCFVVAFTCFILMAVGRNNHQPKHQHQHYQQTTTTSTTSAQPSSTFGCPYAQCELFVVCCNKKLRGNSLQIYINIKKCTRRSKQSE